MEEFQASEFACYTPYGAGRGPADEVDQLGQHFDRMAGRMQAMLEELKTRDTLRAELVNGVSHDLRTPLTCLHGYLETLNLKWEDLGPAERREYFDTALRHSERLGRLVNELFELAKLEARATRPRYEPFSPAELLQDVTQKFRLEAGRNRIDLETQLDERSPFVTADIGLIERVLENLIANAINHTPDGGRILVGLLPGAKSVNLSVADNGCGITPQDLPHVFERYYRGPHAMEDDATHAGLGLAIARRIVALHHSELRVSSGVNMGARFEFDLPVWRPLAPARGNRVGSEEPVISPSAPH
jgi:signal transduction histidine kinase